MLNPDLDDELRCQSCLTSDATGRLPSGDGDGQFVVCTACAHRLENLSLRPLEWYRLASHHGPFCYALHDDFYDENGKAEQYWIPVDEATLFPAPKLAAITAHLPALLDYAITRRSLKFDVVDALKSHMNASVLQEIKVLVEERPSTWVEGRCYEIAARVLGTAGAEWIDARWSSGTRPETWFAYMEAAAHCLPGAETVRRALIALEKVEGMPRSQAARALAHFGSPVVLDWMESQVGPPVAEDWGWLAACSGFSWPIACRWLDGGRPLSLVALDALKTLVRDGGRSLTEGGLRVGELHHRPSDQILIAKLHAYAALDPVPRVTRVVESIEQRLQLRSST